MKAVLLSALCIAFGTTLLLFGLAEPGGYLWLVGAALIAVGGWRAARSLKGGK